MPIDLDKLEALAKAATPGPWKDKSFKRNYDWGVICSGSKRIAQCASADVTDERKRVTFEEKLANAAYIAAACNAVPELIAENRALLERVRELERRIAELAEENSGHKRVIHILENKVLGLKGQPIPMEPRLPTCDALCRPRYILQSNCSNATKEAGNGR